MDEKMFEQGSKKKENIWKVVRFIIFLVALILPISFFFIRSNLVRLLCYLLEVKNYSWKSCTFEALIEMGISDFILLFYYFSLSVFWKKGFKNLKSWRERGLIGILLRAVLFCGGLFLLLALICFRFVENPIEFSSVLILFGISIGILAAGIIGSLKELNILKEE